MSSPNPMTREELLDHAALDALGLLDDYETSLFTRSFHNATPAVQNEILQLQADLVSDPNLLPTESPDPSLRQRVIEAVNTAIELEAVNLEPLATIGRPRRGSSHRSASLAIGTSSLFWRAAALALCATVIVLAYFLNEAYRRNHEITVLVLSDMTSSQLEQMVGPTAKEFILDPSATAFHFKAVAPNQCNAVLYVRESSGEAFLVTEKFQGGETYTLSLKDAAGLTQPVHQFAANVRLSGARFKLDGAQALLKNAAWEITDHTGAVVLASI
jgi:hypothetical protein